MASRADTVSGGHGLPHVARQLYQFSQRRARFLPPSFFGEPAWNVLLDLYASEAEGRAISVTSASLASGAPQTTGMRVLRTLEQKGLVMRDRASEDRRRCDLQLTREGRSALERALDGLAPVLGL